MFTIQLTPCDKAFTQCVLSFKDEDPETFVDYIIYITKPVCDEAYDLFDTALSVALDVLKYDPNHEVVVNLKIRWIEADLTGQNINRLNDAIVEINEMIDFLE